MRRKTVLSAVIALSLTSAAPAFARDDTPRYERDHHEQTPRGDGRERNRQDRPEWARNEHAPRHDQRGQYDQSRSPSWHRPPPPRGAGPNHDFRRGGHLPSHYRRKAYVVHDWRGRHLRAPPRGYHWVRAGSDFVLIAITSGIIAQIVLGQ